MNLSRQQVSRFWIVSSRAQLVSLVSCTNDSGGLIDAVVPAMCFFKLMLPVGLRANFCETRMTLSTELKRSLNWLHRFFFFVRDNWEAFFTKCSSTGHWACAYGFIFSSFTAAYLATSEHSSVKNLWWHPTYQSIARGQKMFATMTGVNKIASN